MSRCSRPAAFSAFFCGATVERRRAKCHPQHHGIRWNVWLEKEHLLPGAVWTWTAGISCFVCKTDGRHEVNPEILARRANTCWLKGCNQAILTLRRHFCIHNICGVEGCVCTFVFSFINQRWKNTFLLFVWSWAPLNPVCSTEHCRAYIRTIKCCVVLKTAKFITKSLTAAQKLENILQFIQIWMLFLWDFPHKNPIF